MRQRGHLAAACFVLAQVVACEASGQLRPGIVFFAEHEGGLHLLESSTGQLMKLEVGFDDVGDLAYSKPAGLLAFEASDSHEAPPSLYVLMRGASRPTLVFRSDRENFLYRPAFDPQGENLYAVSYRTGIHRMSLSDRRWTLVSVFGAPNLNPQGLSFSPSGTRVAISPGRFKGFLLGRVTTDGFTIEQLVLDEFESCTSARWVSETQLVFAGRQAPGIQHLWLFDLSSGSVQQLTHAPVAVRDFLNLSSDRTEVVFTGTDERRPLEWRLWQVRIDGSGLQQLTEGGDHSGHLGAVYVDE